MSDERIAPERILMAIGALSHRAIQVNFAGLAQQSGAVVSSLVFGAMAAAGILPLPRERFEATLKASGIAVNSNLRGFAAAFEAVTGRDTVAGAAMLEKANHGQEDPGQRGFGFPAEVETTAGHGVARLTDYQGKAYADRYLRDLGRVLEAERSSTGARSGWPITREAARYLALMMSYEDIIRVAALKTAPDRWQALYAGNPLAEGDMLRVTEFLKPGVEELASLMPPWLGRRIVRAAERRGKLDAFNLGMGIRTTTVSGFMTMRLLARLRRWRPRSFRFSEEIAAISKWVDLVVEATRIDGAFGAEVVECARIRKGYGSTHRRGAANFEALMEQVVRPAIAAGRTEAARLAALRALALSDPEGSTMMDALRHPVAAEVGRS